MKIIIKKCNWSQTSQKRFKQKILYFWQDYMPQSVENLILDFGSTGKKRPNSYYGDFFNLYNEKSKEIYINLNMFYELKNTNNQKRCLWAVIHELVHVKQIMTQELRILYNGKVAKFQGERYKKLKFRMNTFENYYKESTKKATLYHTKHIPWELEAYKISDKYTGYNTFQN